MALQGAFAEHRQMLLRLGVESVLIRNLEDWNDFLAADASAASSSADGASCLSSATESGISQSAATTNYSGKGLILPGGESTTMMRIMRDECLLEPLSSAIRQGLPTFGTCAGLILLDDQHLGVMDITVLRNAYGRQLGSFYTEHECGSLGVIPMTFIRAPYIERVGDGVEVLSVLDGHIVAARQDNMLGTSFHPELNDDLSVHRYFLEMISENNVLRKLTVNS